MTFKILNLTPHTVNLLDKNGVELRAIPSDGNSPRLSSSTDPAGTVEGFPLVRQTFGDTVGLPDETPGTLILVSRLVFAANPDRNDLAVPVDFVRGDQGQILGCKAFEVR